MAHEQFECDRYSVHLKRGGPRQGVPDVQAASIHIFRTVGERRCAFIIYFWLDMSGAPENTSVSSPDRLVGYMHVTADQYPWYIDLLRNEKPVVALIDDDPKMNGLNVRYEEVGEEES